MLCTNKGKGPIKGGIPTQIPTMRDGDNILTLDGGKETIFQGTCKEIHHKAWFQ